jgi:hypothetical protein
MVYVFTETTIAVAFEKVTGYAINPDLAPEWYVNIKWAEWKTPKPLTIGSKIAFKAKCNELKLSYVYEITELIPGQKLVMRTTEGPFPMETTYTWESIDINSTRMILRNKGNPTGFSKLFAPFMAIMMKRANQKDLEKLKEILESISNLG